MKKTKKAMLAAIACTLAVAGSGVILAACNGDTDNEPTAHSHNWSNWLVEEENMPTAESGGKATRNCNGEGDCDAETSDTEYLLPSLNGNDYTVSNNTAEVGVSGTGKYTYNKDGVNVEFIAETPAKPHVHDGGVWTVTDENQPTADSKGTATRVCTATDDFCDWTEDDLVYELPELNDTDYSVNVKSTATCLTQGETEYTFNKDGVNVTFTVVTDINPQAHTLKKHNASEADCGLGQDGNIEYYSCECGKLFHDAEGQEEIDSVSDTVLPAEHTLSAVAANANSEVVKYPNDTSATFRNMAHYECGDCGKLFKDENGENEVTSVFALTRCGMLLSYGDNLVDATDVAAAKNGNLYFMTFIAETNGVYQITFNDGVTINTVQYIITGAKTPSTPNAYTSGAWNSESTVFNRFTMSDTTQPLTNSVTVNMVAGEWVFIVVDSVKYSVNIATQPVLVEGANKIDITEAYSVEFNDKYDFVPNETKAYSMTVPAGMVVLMNGQEFLDGDTTSANFEGVAGEKIEFAFGYTQSGAVTVTIGEAVDLPKITPDEPLSAFRIEGHAVSVLEVGDIEEGTYTITLTVPSGLMRSFVYFGKNVSENYEDYFLSNGNPVSGNPAEVSFQFPNATVLNGAPYTATLKTVTWTVTLDLKAGDKLVFITSSTGGDVNVSMVAA